MSIAYDPVPLAGYQHLDIAETRARATEFLALARRRRSIREFSDRPVPRDVIETCLLAAGTAPSGANHQPWHFAAVSSPELKRRIRVEAEIEEKAFYAGKAGEEWLGALAPLGTDAGKGFLEVAPWLITIFGARRSVSADGVMRKNYYVPESVSIATGFLVMALHQAGLASLTHTPSPMGFLNEICGRPETEKPYILLVVGYPAEGCTVPAYATTRKPLEEIASFL
jgi:iodotyrosine deiodinase